MSKIFRVLVPLLCVLLGAPAGGDALPTPLEKPPAGVRNIILIIGDGMGPQQFALPMLYARYSKESQVARPLNLEKLLNAGELGLIQPSAHEALVADSACAGGALAAGVETLPGTIGLDARGAPVKTILERARDAGKATGLVSDTRMTHATPAVFAAHVPDRNMENEIAVQMLGERVDVLLSGGLRHWIPAGVDNAEHPAHRFLADLIQGRISLKSKRTDDRNLLREALASGYDLAFDRAALVRSNGRKILGLFSESGMPDGIEESSGLQDHTRTVPTLAEMVQKALQTLEKNPKGFFLMVESGQIDWAGHSNDAGLLLHEMLRLERTLGVILTWAKGRNDTLIVLTADHETGSFGFSYSGFQIPDPRPFDAKSAQELLYNPRFNFVDPAVLDRLYHQKKSLADIVADFDRLPGREQTGATYTRVIEQNTDFSISLLQAEAALAQGPNRYYRQGHEKLGAKRFPLINDFPAFYPDPDNARTALIARALGEQEGVVWGTGTHTNIPVPIVALGPKRIQARFGGYQQQDGIGKLLGELVVGTSQTTRANH